MPKIKQEEYESEGTEVKKDIEWLKKWIYEYEDEIGSWLGDKHTGDYFSTRLHGSLSAIKEIREKLNQLDEPEVLSREFINEKAVEVYADTADAEVHAVFRMRDLQNLLVPKQEEPTQEQVQKYLSEHGIEVVEKEPETVADVVTTFWKSYERLKEVMSMEVEELEE